jgi:hypothetical protein
MVPETDHCGDRELTAMLLPVWYWTSMNRTSRLFVSTTGASSHVDWHSTAHEPRVRMFAFLA